MTSWIEQYTEQNERRMKEDRDMILAPLGWPQPKVLHLKTQPWAKDREYGITTAEDVRAQRWRVHIKDTHVIEQFDTLEDMVIRWSVD